MDKRILVIAPHADDEVLGCGGYLLHQRHALKKVVVGTIGGMDVRQDFKVRKEEFELVCHKLEAAGSWLFENMDAMLDTIPSRELITSLDYEIDRYRPDEIFINYRSHHQDHAKMYECAMASLRLREGYRPKFVALYEYPFITNETEEVDGGKAYHDITDVINEKVHLFNLYRSQVRKAPSPLNEEGIKSLAHVRGMECGVKFAEKFYIQKMMV
jgi:LmbE family N-acetylglucosaminyl deacetylase